MEREIKFEYGFESKNGIVKKVYHIHEIQNIKEICDVWNVLPFVYRRQFTGLKDKNGKEIYEGDVVENKQWKPETFQVGFDRGGFCFFNDGDDYYNDCKYLEQFEITGNIFENPELLKKAATDVS